MIHHARRSKQSGLATLALLIGCATALGGCVSKEDVVLSKRQPFVERSLRLGERVPDQSEAATIGPITERIRRRSPAFSRLVRVEDDDLVFKDEEGTGADRLMTPRLQAKLLSLSAFVERQWPGLRVRVTEAWDESGEHGEASVHYEGRAADITTSDVDPQKLGRLASLAVSAGLDWVFYEDASHVHVSVRP